MSGNLSGVGSVVTSTTAGGVGGGLVVTSTTAGGVGGGLVVTSTTAGGVGGGGRGSCGDFGGGRQGSWGGVVCSSQGCVNGNDAESYLLPCDVCLFNFMVDVFFLDEFEEFFILFSEDFQLLLQGVLVLPESLQVGSIM